jgi:hypothetical protein
MTEKTKKPSKNVVLADGKTVAKMTEEEKRAFAVDLLERIVKAKP